MTTTHPDSGHYYNEMLAMWQNRTKQLLLADVWYVKLKDKLNVEMREQVEVKLACT